MKASGIGLILIAAGLVTLCMAQNDSSDKFAGGLPESYVRECAIKKVMPSYPVEAIRRGLSGVVRLKIEIGIDGEVL
jgi:hypothetical protein